jgi:hypothetical protein
MAAKKSKQYSHQWPDGTWHSISWSDHQFNQTKAGPGEVKIAAPGGEFIPISQHDFGYGPGVTQPPVVTPQPFDPMAEAAKQSATWNITTGDAEANYQTGRTAYSTGYNADGSLNTSNPYSQAVLLQDNYKRSQTGTNNSLTSAELFGSGARAYGQARNDRLYAEGSASLRDSAQDRYHGIQAGRLQNYGQNSMGGSQAGYDALRTSIYGG